MWVGFLNASPLTVEIIIFNKTVLFPKVVTASPDVITPLWRGTIFLLTRLLVNGSKKVNYWYATSHFSSKIFVQMPSYFTEMLPLKAKRKAFLTGAYV